MSNKIVDYFPYFDETGQELLKLRVNILKDHVDYFVITESNKTQSGRNIERKLRQRIKQYNLPEDKIIIIDLDIPEDSDLDVQQIDVLNCYDGNFVNNNSLLARVRERMQKDAIITVLDRFSDDDVFIVSDSDEIIRPDIINFYSGETLKYPNFILKFPLIHLEGRADLRVINKNNKQPKWWDSLFMCTKAQLKISTPTQIRSNIGHSFTLTNYQHDGNVCTDLGWHFSWMGDYGRRKIKANSFTHFDDNLSFLKDSKYSKSDSVLLNNPKEGDIPPSGDVNFVLERYSIENLPKEVFMFEDIREFLLPSSDNNNIFRHEYDMMVNTVSDINEHLPVLYNLAKQCSHVTEFGVRDGKSTRAFLYADVTLRSYDLYLDENVIKLFLIADEHNKDAKYIKGDSTKVNIAETDLLFIDTWHCYNQVKKELNNHHSKVRKYIVFHDTHSFGLFGERFSGSETQILTDIEENPLGILPAIIEFMIEHPEWKFHIHRKNNNGLTVLKRVYE